MNAIRAKFLSVFRSEADDFKAGFAAFIMCDGDVHPAHSIRPSKPDGLHERLFRGKADRKSLGARRPISAVRLFAGRKAAVEKALSGAFKDAFKFGD